MAIVLLGSVSIANGTSAPVDTTGATLFVAVNGTNAVTAPSDSQANGWGSTDCSAAGGGFGGTAAIFHVNAPTTSPVHTFTGGGLLNGLCVSWYSGTDLTTPLVTANAASAASAASVTPGVDGSLIVCGTGGPYTPPLAIDAGLTIRQAINGLGGVSYGADLADLIQGTAAAIDPTWSSGATFEIGIACIAVFAPAAGGGPTDAQNVGIFDQQRAGAMIGQTWLQALIAREAQQRQRRDRWARTLFQRRRDHARIAQR